MFSIDKKYFINKPFKNTDFINKTLSRAEKIELKKLIKQGVLKYQIYGEDIPSLINETYNYQVIMFFEIEVTNIKKSYFINDLLQKTILAPCIFKFTDNKNICYGFADKRLSQTNNNEIVIDDNYVSNIFTINTTQNEYLNYFNIKNKTNKRCLYTELLIKTFIADNIKLISNLNLVFDSKLWYSEEQKLNFYFKLKELKKLSVLIITVNTAKEKVAINNKIKDLITELKTFYTD
ncbi:MAG: DUF4391 domain-containing protein [Endomicrobiaceae bacterium]|nr:DUF4391 domain-containing protein [Endomicrobiaceae bacterium]